jgi:hypothetical protein
MPKRMVVGIVGMVVLLLVPAGCAVRLPETRECDRAAADRPVCGLQNPEDVVALPGTRWLLASQIQRPGDPSGSIVAFTRDGAKVFTVVGPSHPAERLDDPFLAKNAEICPGPLPPGGLAPHGIELVVDGKAPWMLLVVNHGTRESIEVYDVTPGKSAPRLRWIGCVPLPEGFTANDVAALPDGEMVISASATRSMSVAFFQFMFGWPVGDVMQWSSDGGWRHVAASTVGMPNGVAVRGDLLFVADWSNSRLVRIDRTTGRRDAIALPHHPDNLSWTADGRLLVAGQLGSARIALGCMDAAVRSCGQPWSVLSVDPDTLAVTTIAEGDGRDFGAASSAVLVDDTLVVGTWAGDRVLRRRE